MLFVHFTPRSNIQDIKHHGLRPGRRGVRLFPMVRGEKTLVNLWNRPLWWREGTPKHDRSMAKIVVRLPPDVRVVAEDWICLAGPHRDIQEGWITLRELGVIVQDLLKEWRGQGNDPEWDIRRFVGFEVLYPKRIPPAWIVKILDRSDTDQRSRAYRRSRSRRTVEEGV